tara:strand:- start:126 stop:338 length:213 start_codon:yes stop_codon:yes gene_type:complete
MKRLLLALSAVIVLPNAVNAESYWLILFDVKTGIEKIEMESIEQCEENGEKFKNMKFYAPHKNYVCLRGK